MAEVIAEAVTVEANIELLLRGDSRRVQPLPRTTDARAPASRPASALPPPPRELPQCWYWPERHYHRNCPAALEHANASIGPAYTTESETFRRCRCCPFDHRPGKCPVMFEVNKPLSSSCTTPRSPHRTPRRPPTPLVFCQLTTTFPPSKPRKMTTPQAVSVPGRTKRSSLGHRARRTWQSSPSQPINFTTDCGG